MLTVSPEKICQILARYKTRRRLYSGEVAVNPANTEPLELQIDSNAHFLSTALYLSYTTLAAGPVDTGAPQINVRISDNGKYFLADDFVAIETIAVPGRVRSAGIAGDVSQGLNVPGFELLYPWAANTQAEFEFQNQSDFANVVNVTLAGYRIPIGKVPELDALVPGG